MSETLRYLDLDPQKTYVTMRGLEALRTKLATTQANVERKKSDAAAEHDDEWDKHNEAAVHAKQDLGIAMSLAQSLLGDLNNVEFIVPSTQTDFVDIGNKVSVYFEDEDEVEVYTIMDRYEYEADPDQFVSWRSPLAQAILGKKKGDTATYEVRGVPITVQVKKIEAGDFQSA